MLCLLILAEKTPYNRASILCSEIYTDLICICALISWHLSQIHKLCDVKNIPWNFGFHGFRPTYLALSRAQLHLDRPRPAIAQPGLARPVHRTSRHLTGRGRAKIRRAQILNGHAAIERGHGRTGPVQRWPGPSSTSGRPGGFGSRRRTSRLHSSTARIGLVRGRQVTGQ